MQSFNYLGVKLIPHHGNVMDTKQFPIEWWGQFNFIFNALDNLEARRYVNKMALFLRKPLMESGTTGYAGQIQPIYPYYSECFDCHPKETPNLSPYALSDQHHLNQFIALPGLRSFVSSTI